LQCAPSLVSQEIIEAALRRAGIAEQEMRQWEKFYTCMYENAFFTHEIVKNDKDCLFKQAIEWVSKLEQLL
jgi:putative alpha-1,2-mannosidase